MVAAGGSKSLEHCPVVVKEFGLCDPTLLLSVRQWWPPLFITTNKAYKQGM